METNEGCSFWMKARGPDFHRLEGSEPVNMEYADLRLNCISFNTLFPALILASWWEVL